MLERWAHLDRVLGVPWEVLEYERFLAERPQDDGDYLFAEARVRFQARDADRLRAASDLEVVEKHGELQLFSELAGGGVPLGRVQRTVAERVAARIDGNRTLAELRAFSGADRPTFERLLSAGLGRVLFVPEALGELERSVSGVELVRFVGVPYEIVRNYWSNMVCVRAFLEEQLPQISDPDSLVRVLQRAHVLGLLGDDQRSFYRPSSRIADRGAHPGQLYTTPTRVVRTPQGTLLLEGPRVGVSLMGGELYHRALYTSVGDPEALAPDRALVDSQGLPWGELITGRAVDDLDPKAWFCPPRPIRPAHFVALFDSLREALSAVHAHDEERAIPALGRFHHRFVRLHPFRCANQSLAISFTNLLLTICLGAGIPHLLLDQLALRTAEDPYLRLFELAVGEHLVCGTSEERWAVLREAKNRAYGLIQKLQSTKSDAEAWELIRNDPRSAGSALIAQ